MEKKKLSVSFFSNQAQHKKIIHVIIMIIFKKREGGGGLPTDYINSMYIVGTASLQKQSYEQFYKTFVKNCKQNIRDFS